MTYTELKDAICSYLQNYEQDFVANIPLFVQQTEERVFNTVQFPSLRRNVTGTTSTANKYLACPGDFLAAYSMAVVDATGRYEYLLNKDVNFIRQAYPTPTSLGFPKYYALFGPSFANSDELSFILGPTPDSQYTVELHYFFYPESISTSANGRSWLGDNFDPVLLYGSLVEAYTFLKGEADLIALYNTKYTEALAMAKRLGDGLERGDAYRDGQYKQRVT